MIDKDQFAQSLARECDIIVHLFSKIAPDAYDYRPALIRSSARRVIER